MNSLPSITYVNIAPARTELTSVCKVNEWSHNEDASTRCDYMPPSRRRLPLNPPPTQWVTTSRA